MNASRWADARQVLCVRLDSLGDVLMTTPALKALKHGHPQRRLTLLTSPSGAAVARAIADIDDVIEYEAPWMKATVMPHSGAMDLGLIERLRQERFEAAVIFTVYSQSPLPAALMCLLAGIPLRLAHCRENPYRLLTDWVREPEPERMVRHEVQRQIDLVAAIGCTARDERLGLRVAPEFRQGADARLRAIGIRPGSRWVLIHPGASAPSRRYPADGFAQAADVLARDHGCSIVFSGTETERALVESVRGKMSQRSVSMVGDAPVAEFAAVVERAPLLISNNTGPVHIAAAVGTPVVDLYAQTNPQHTPWRVPCRVLYHDVPCKYCYRSECPEGHHDCLRLVSPERVVEAARELLALA